MRTTIPNNPEVKFVEDWIAEIPSDSTAEQRAEQEAEAVEFIQQLEDKETRKLAIDALKGRIKTRSEVFDDLVYGEHPLIEATPADLPRLGERLLAGKNAAIVVRGSSYQDFGAEVLGPVRELRGFRRVEEEKFPHQGNGRGHSRVHLDNFIGPSGSHFRYDLTMSRTDRGRVLFIGGLASKVALGWSPDEYDKAFRAVNTSGNILGLEERATDRVSPRGPKTGTEWQQSTKGATGTFIATTLNEGDVVLWPQGGLEAALPAWHGFFQIGHPSQQNFVPRQSTSYHLSLPTTEHRRDKI